MRLKSLQIQGFKSFPDKIELTFDTGMTAVVGPNGSGKSNISDAVRWVLGEQSSKSLRGNKMEDVIFSGTKSRKASAFASVTLTIDNSDRGLSIQEDEVSINRKLYRNGESTYRINGKSVRLKDVSELFMDTGLGRDGYSIIGQGKVAEIVSSKSSERREIFDEASGISKFRYKKLEAEKELTLANENMLRLNDIVAELENRIEPLKVQSDKAKRFLELSERHKSLEVSVWSFKSDGLRSTLSDLNDRINATQRQYEDLQSEVETGEVNIQNGYIEMQGSSIKVDTLRREVLNSQQKLAESKSSIAVWQNDIDHAKGKVLELKQSKEDNMASEKGLRLKATELEDSIKGAEHSLDGISCQLEVLNGSLSDMDSQSASLNDEILDVSSKINLIKHDIQKENLTLTSMQTIIEETRSQLDRLEDDNREFEKLCETYKMEVIQVRSNFDNYTAESVKLNDQLSGFKQLLFDRETKLKVAKQSYERVSLKVKEKQHRIKVLTDLESSMEGFSRSVKLIMQSVNKGNLKGVFGSVAQLIETSQEYVTAIEVALGGTMQHIVVQDEEVAKDCIRYLKSIDGGRSTFLPLTSIKPQKFTISDIKGESGFIAMANDLVTCDVKFQNVKDSLLSRIVIMENIGCATIMAKKYGYRFKIVTLDGQVVNAGGSFTGGSAIHFGGIFSRKNEIDALKQELDGLLIEEKSLVGEINTLNLEVDTINSNVDELSRQTLESKSISMQYRADLKRLNDTIKQYSNSLSSMDVQRSTLLKKLEMCTSRKTQCENILCDYEESLSTLEEAYNLKEVSRDTLSQERGVLLDEVSKLKISQVERSKDLETLKDTLNGIKDTILSYEVQDSNIVQEISANEDLILERRQYIKDSQLLEQELSKSIETLNVEVRSWQNIHRQQEERVTQIRLSLKEVNTNKENVSKELIRLDEKRKVAQRDYDSLVAQLFDIYGITFSEAERFATPVEDIQSAQIELSRIKAEMKRLGNVNLSAIDEYKEVSERYTFLNEQLKDAQKSKVELERLMESLTKDMKTLFKESFYNINEHFKRIFVELFGGGSAELVLTNKDDILNSGIEILVSPPGKVIKSLMSLSGGEQAFVSIAIYFAILSVRPSPFCILDEIDAPLDEVNVRRYATYLSKFIEKTQFIVVTHRRGTMETANVLYGVTMQKDGVSKLIKMEQKDISTENF